MSGLEHPLRPFQPAPHLQELALVCHAERQGQRLALTYRLSGPLGDLVLPERNPRPQRRDGLWESTCFEAFLGIPSQPGYWEINLAPSGDWNVYALGGYRQGLRQERRVASLPFQLHQEPGGLRLELELELGALMPLNSPLELSATAVLEQREHGCSYWAWHHSGPEADFHRRESFQPLQRPGA